MERAVRVFTLAFSQGVAAMRRHPRKAIAASLAYWLPALALILNFGPLLGLGTLGRKLVQPIVYLFFVPVCAVLYAALIAAVGRPRRAGALERALLRAGVVNHNNEPPIVTAVDDKSMTLYMGGADPTALLDNLALEAALCLKIGAVSEGRDNRFVIVKTAPGSAKLPHHVNFPWDKVTEDATLLLGKSIVGTVSLDLGKIPHILIGGSTGSGKTVLVKSIIHQFLAKGAETYLIDLKGGTDYAPAWRGETCGFADNAQDALAVLTYIDNELQTRKLEFESMSRLHNTICNSLDDYNRLAGEYNHYKRIAVVVDELAELTDMTGMDKPQKELAAAIIKHLSSIARMGRAFGISLIVATQRPDAAALPGSIKSNIDCRICGRADNVLSQIILDNTSAAEKVPKDEQGVFLMNDGTLFKGYLLNEEQY